jgi:PAS domain S-box-containing protein
MDTHLAFTPDTLNDAQAEEARLATEQLVSLAAAEGLLKDLASVFFPEGSTPAFKATSIASELPDVEAGYRTLVEQIPAVVFMAFLDKGIGEAYVSPQIEAMLGFSQQEWLNDPVRWYQQIHPEDKERWNIEAAQMFLSGEPLKSVYRVIARDGHVVWFHCEAKMVRSSDGRPWFIHGVAFDITELKNAEKAQREYADRLKVLSRRLMEVQETERRNIARELHDEIGQVLTGLKLTLEMGSRLPPEGVRTSLEQARILVNELMARARKLSLDLRPGMLDDLGLVPALLWHIEHYTALTKVHVDFMHSGLEGRRFSTEVETASYRIVQEALTNVARHSGASEATARIWTKDGKLLIKVEDAGCGFDPEASLASKETSGLAGMLERAVLMEGITMSL